MSELVIEKDHDAPTVGARIDRAIGIAAIIIGILVLVGEVSFGWLVPLFGAFLVVIGILMLLDVVRGGKVVGLAFMVVGVLLLVNLLAVPALFGRALDLVLGIILLVVGIMRLT